MTDIAEVRKALALIAEAAGSGYDECYNIVLAALSRLERSAAPGGVEEQGY
jgi:hypothetical protein